MNTATHENGGTLSTIMAGWLSASRSRDRAASLDSSTLVLIELVYDPADPWTISVHFPEPKWLLFREDLWSCTQGSLSRGLGDVRITSERQGFTRIDLSSPTGKASLWLDTPTLNEFLYMSYVLIPEGQEMKGVDWEYETCLLLDGGAWS